jgi:hypothetical protein
MENPESLIQTYRQMHASGEFDSQTIRTYEASIHRLIRKTGAKTVLDYGSAKGQVWQTWAPAWGVRATLYDPGVPGIDVLPNEDYDVVICCDVLEHIPRQAAISAIDDLFARARMAVWASVCCRPANKRLPDGTNAHVTIEPIEWWRSHFQRASRLFGRPRWQLHETK